MIYRIIVVKFLIEILLLPVTTQDYTSGTCSYPFGVKDGNLQDFQLTSNQQRGPSGSWQLRDGGPSFLLNAEGDLGGWFQIDLLLPQRVTSIEVTQTTSSPIQLQCCNDTLWDTGTVLIIDQLTFDGDGIAILDTAIDVRYVRLITTEPNVEITSVELYGCTLGSTVGADSTINDISMVKTTECDSTIGLGNMIYVTAILVEVDTNNTDTIYINLTNYIDDNETVPIQIEEYHRLSITEFEVWFARPIFSMGIQISCYPENVSCRFFTMFGRRLEGCPSTFVEYEGRCYWSSPLLTDLTDTETRESVCGTTRWGEFATLATTHTFQALDFLDFFNRPEDTDTGGQIYTGLFFRSTNSTITGDGIDLWDNWNQWLIDDNSTEGANCATVYKGLLAIVPCSQELQYICEVPHLDYSGYVNSHCKWTIQKGILSSRNSDQLTLTPLISECMNFCQRTACASLSYNYNTNECFIRTVHIYDDSVEITESMGTVSFDYYCIQEQASACKDEWNVCSSRSTMECADPDYHEFCTSLCQSCSDVLSITAASCKLVANLLLNSQLHFCDVHNMVPACSRELVDPGNILSNQTELTIQASHSMADNIRMLGFTEFWAPPPNTMAWMKFNFTAVKKMTAVFALCGEGCFVEQVLLYSTNDSVFYVPYSYEELHPCSSSHDSNMIILGRPVVAKVFMFVVPDNSANPCLKMQLYGCEVNGSQSESMESYALGMRDGFIQDSQLSSNGFASEPGISYSPPWQARLGNDVSGRSTPFENNVFDLGSEGTWLQVEFASIHTIIAIEFQPGSSAGQPFQGLTSVKIEYTPETYDDLEFIANAEGAVTGCILNRGVIGTRNFKSLIMYHEAWCGNSFDYYRSDSLTQVFHARSLLDIRVLIQFDPINARFVRVHPNEFTGSTAKFLMEIYGFPKVDACPALRKDFLEIPPNSPSDLLFNIPTSASSTSEIILLNRARLNIHALTIRGNTGSIALSTVTIVSHNIQKVISLVGQQDESDPNTIHYSLKRTYPATSIKLSPISIQGTVKVYACTVNACPPGYVSQFTYCLRYTPGAFTHNSTMAQMDSLCQDTWFSKSGYLLRINDDDARHVWKVAAASHNSILTSSAIHENGVSYWYPQTQLTYAASNLPWAGEYAGFNFTYGCIGIRSDGAVPVSCDQMTEMGCTLGDVSVSNEIRQNYWNVHQDQMPEGAPVLRQLEGYTLFQCMELCSKGMFPTCTGITYSNHTSNCTLYDSDAISRVNVEGNHYLVYRSERHYIVSSFSMVFHNWPENQTMISELSFSYDISFNFTNADVKVMPQSDITSKVWLTNAITLEDVEFRYPVTLPNPMIYNLGTFRRNRPSALSGESVTYTESGIGNFTLDVCSASHHICLVVHPSNNFYLYGGYASHFTCVPLARYIQCTAIEIEGFWMEVHALNDSDVHVAALFSNLTFTFGWTRGSNVSCAMTSTPLGISYSWHAATSEYVFDASVSGEVTLLTAGSFQVTMTCHNLASSLSVVTSIRVEPLLNDLLAISLEYIPSHVPIDVTYKLLTSSEYQPNTAVFDVSCEVVYSTSPSLTSQTVTLSINPIVETLLPSSYTQDNELGLVAADVTCSNTVSNVSETFEIRIRQDILNGIVELDDIGFIVGDPAIFSCSVEQGSHVNIEINYGDNGNETVVEYASLTNGLAVQSWSIEHVYNSVGNYTVTIVRMFNEFYSESLNTSLYVAIQNNITELVVNTTEYFLTPPGSIAFGLDTGTEQLPIDNIYCEWEINFGSIQRFVRFYEMLPTIFEPDDPIVDTEDTLVEMFGVCSNAASQYMTQTISFQLYKDDIDLVNFEVIDSDWWRNATIFRFTVGVLHSPVTYQFEMADSGGQSLMCRLSNPGEVSSSEECYFENTLTENTTTIELRYVYPTWGTHSVWYTVENSHAEFTLRGVNIPFEVIEWTCVFLDIQLEEDISNGTRREVMRSVISFYSVDVIAYDCMKSDRFRYEWFTEINSVRTILPDTTANLTILPRFLEYGEYNVISKVCMDIDAAIFGEGDPVCAEATGAISITRSPLVAVLENSATGIDVHHNHIFTLDASSSYDPDRDSGQYCCFNYQWQCREEPLVDVIDFFNPASTVNSLCSSTMSSVLSDLNVHEIDIQGQLPQATLKAGYSYTFRVTVSHPLHPPTPPINVVVNVELPAAPVINIECSSGCLNADEIVVPVDRTKMFSYTCTDNCESFFGELAQVWSIFALDEHGNCLDSSTDYAQAEGVVVTVPTAERAILAANGLPGGAKYIIFADVNTPGSIVGRANLTFWVSLPPFGGSCFSEPYAGIALIQTFTIACSNWQAWQIPNSDVSLPTSLTYTYNARIEFTPRVQQISESRESSFSSDLFPAGNLFLSVGVIDDAGSTTVYTDIENIFVIRPEFDSNMELVEYLLSLIPGIDPDNIERAVQMINAILSILSYTVDPLEGILLSNSSVHLRGTQLREQLMSLLIAIPMNMSHLIYFGQITENVATTSQQISPTLVNTSSAMFSSMTNTLIANLANLDPDTRKAAGGLLLRGMNSMVLASNVLAPRSRNTSEPLPAEFVHGLRNVDQLNRHIAENISYILRPFESEFINETGIQMGINKLNASDVFGNVNAIGSASVFIPSDPNEPLECITRKMILSTGNPMLYGDDSISVNSNIFTVLLEDGCGNTADTRRRKRSTSFGEPYEVVLPVGQSKIVDVEDDYPRSRVLRHIRNITDPDANYIISVYPRPGLSMNVYINYNDEASEENNVLQIQVPQNVSLDTSLSEEDIYELRHTFWIPAENITEFNVTQIHVGVLFHECDDLVPSCSMVGGLLYRYGISEATCRTWDAQNELWIRQECELQPTTTARSVKFKSNLLGSLGGGVFVGPNLIDFDTVFDNLGQKLIDNAAVVGTVVGIIILFIPLCVLCRLWDKKDQLKWSILPLADNEDEDENPYEIHVNTGLRSKSGTDSNVMMVIAGTESDSGVRKLDDGIRKVFDRGDVTSFLMTTPDPLGTPYILKIWHDNSGIGSKASWFLSKIVIVDIRNNKWYVFLCDDWLALDESDGCIERTLRLSTSQDIKSSDSLLQNNIRRKMFDDHIWFSVGYRKSRSNFTRVQRLCVCLSILFLMMIANAMWYKGPDDEANGEGGQAAITIGPISLTVMQIYASILSSIMVVPPVVIMTTLFAKSAPRHSPSQSYYRFGAKTAIQREDNNVNRKKKFPFLCIYIAYFLVSLSVATSAFFTMLYAFQWEKKKSEQWLLTFILSFFESVILIQPIKVFVLAILFTFLLKKDTEVSDHEVELGKMQEREEHIKMKYGDNIASSVELSLDEKEAIRQKADQDRKLKLMISEVLWQLILLALMCCVVAGNLGSLVYTQNEHMRNVFLDGIPEDGNKAELIVWLKETVIENLYNTLDYNEHNLQPYMNKFISNGYAMRLGPPRLRLLRVESDRCKIASSVKQLIHTCTVDYSHEKMDETSYGPAWSNLSAVHEEERDTPLAKAFVYITEKQLKGYRYWGVKHVYSGGGYVANLGNEKEPALQLVDQLVENEWIDRYSRIFIVEFNVWNANTKIFNYVLITFELPTEGGMIPQVHIGSVVLYRYTGAGGLLALLAEIILTICMIILAVREGIQMFKHRLKYFKHFWSVIRLFCVLFFFAGLGVYAWRSVLTARTMEEMMNNREQTINFQALALTSDVYIMLMALSAFLVQMGLLHILRYNRTISDMAHTLRASAMDMINVGMCLLIVIAGFGTFLFIHFGYSVFDYRSVPSTLSTMLSGCLGKFDFQNILESPARDGAVMLLLYELFMMYFMMNIFIAILTKFISEIQRDQDALPSDHEVIKYMIEMIKKSVGIVDQEHLDGIRKKNRDQQQSIDEVHSLDLMAVRIKMLDQLVEGMNPSPVIVEMGHLFEQFLHKEKHGFTSSADNNYMTNEDGQDEQDSEADLDLILKTAMLISIKPALAKTSSSTPGRI